MPNFIYRNFGGGIYYPFMKSVTLWTPVCGHSHRVKLEVGD